MLAFVDAPLPHETSESPDAFAASVSELRTRIACLRDYKIPVAGRTSDFFRDLSVAADDGDVTAAATVIASSEVHLVPAKDTELGVPAIVWTVMGKWNTPPLTRHRAVTVAGGGFIDARMGVAQSINGRASAQFPAVVSGLPDRWSHAIVYHENGAISRGEEGDPFALPAAILQNGTKFFRYRGERGRCGVFASDVYAEGYVLFAEPFSGCGDFPLELSKEHGSQKCPNK